MQVDGRSIPAGIRKPISVHITPDAIFTDVLSHLISQILVPCGTDQDFASKGGVPLIGLLLSGHEVHEANRPVAVICKVLVN